MRDIFKPQRTGNIFTDIYVIRNGNRPKEVDIRRLNQILDNEENKFRLDPIVDRDLKAYKEFLWEKARIWEGYGDKETKEQRSEDLRINFGQYKV
ncbi:MAG: hypothetical protein ABIB79_01740 [archaeon]